MWTTSFPFARMGEALRPYDDRLILPTTPPDTDPCWFAFVITVRPDAGFTRADLTAFRAGQLTKDEALKRMEVRVF